MHYWSTESESFGGIALFQVDEGVIAPLLTITPQKPEYLDVIRDQMKHLTDVLPPFEGTKAVDGRVIHVTLRKLSKGKWSLSVTANAPFLLVGSEFNAGFVRMNHEWFLDAADHIVQQWLDCAREREMVFFTVLPEMNGMPDRDYVVVVPYENIKVVR